MQKLRQFLSTLTMSIMFLTFLLMAMSVLAFEHHHSTTQSPQKKSNTHITELYSSGFANSVVSHYPNLRIH